MSRRKLRGIQQRGQAWRTSVRVHGQLYQQTWELSTPLEDLQQWITDQKKLYKSAGPSAGSFGADIAEYLQRVAAMPIIKQRTAHLALWAEALGRDRPRASITAADIDKVLQGWLGAGLANGTVRKRRTALRSFFSKMDPGKVNPVKASANPKEAKPEARAIDYVLLERAIAAMPDTRSHKPGVVVKPALAKLRARVMAYTGLPPHLLQTITASDLSMATGTVRVRARHKGAGVEARTLTLTPDGLDAFKRFHAAQAYGSFATEALNRSFKRGCKRAGLDPTAVHLYDLRHSFLSQVYRVTRDLATVARLGLHAPGSTVTARYAMGANAEVDAAAVAAFSASLVAQRQAIAAPMAGQLSGQKLPRKVAKRNKVNRKKQLREVS